MVACHEEHCKGYAKKVADDRKPYLKRSNNLRVQRILKEMSRSRYVLLIQLTKEINGCIYK